MHVLHHQHHHPVHSLPKDNNKKVHIYVQQDIQVIHLLYTDTHTCIHFKQLLY